MSIFVSTTYIKDGSKVTDAVKQLTDNGIFNIELGSTHACEDDLLGKLNNSKCSYITHNFFPPQKDRIILNIASLNENIRRESIKFIRLSIDFAVSIGAKVYTIHPGFLIEPDNEANSEKNYDFNFSKSKDSNYQESMNVLLRSIDEIINYSLNSSVKVAIEVQGSATHKDAVLFSRSDEFEKILKHNKKVFVNLNLAHLHLASSAWGFDINKAIDILKDRVVAVEVSHSQNEEDSHAGLEPNGWYIDLLKKRIFDDIPVIFEGRNLAIEDVLRSYRILEDIFKVKCQ